MGWDEYRMSAERAFSAGHFSVAEMQWFCALQEAEEFDRTDRRLAYTIERFAEACWRIDRHVQAEALARRLVRLFEKSFGADHLDTATVVYNLAIVCHAQKKYAEAETLYMRALGVRRNSLGDKHADTLAILENYANLLETLGRGAEAKHLRVVAKGFTVNHWKRSGVFPAFQEPDDSEFEVQGASLAGDK